MSVRRDIVSRTNEDVRIIDKNVKNPWRWNWLEKTVKGIHVREVIRKLNAPGLAYCLTCQKELMYGSRGFAALSSHIESAKHNISIEARQSNTALPGAGGCNNDNSSTTYGLHPMFKSGVTSVENKLPEPSVPLSDRIANSEAMLLSFLAEKSLPFALVPDLLHLVKELSKDQKALHGIKMHRMSATYKLRYGVAKTFHENLVQDLKTQKFSLNIDESTSNSNEKVVTVLVNCLRKDKIITEHLHSFSVNNVYSATIFDGIVEVMEKNEIPWNNLMSVLLDSCNVMRGKKAGLETKIKAKCPHLLDIDGDSCHHAHNAAKAFCKSFGFHVEYLFSDIHNDLKWSPDLRAALMEICQILNIKYTMPQNYVSFRWLSVYDAAQDFTRMSNALTLFYYSFLCKSKKIDFLHIVISIYKHHNVNKTGREYIQKIHASLAEKNMTSAGNERKDRITKKLFEDSLTTKLITNLFISVLPLLQEYVKIFQSGIPLIHKLHDKQFELLKTFLALFIKPDIFSLIGDSIKQILQLDVKNKNNHLPMHSVFIGEKTKELISAAPKSKQDKIQLFKNNTMKAYVACAQALQKKMPIGNTFLKCVSSIDPLSRQNHFALKFMKQLPNLVTNVLSPHEIEPFDLEVHKYHSDALQMPKEDQKIDEWWLEIKKTNKYPLLFKMVSALLTCFHGPKVESSFSMMNSIISAGNSRLSIPTFSAIQTVKYHLLAEKKTSVAYFAKTKFLQDHVEKKLVENLRFSYKSYQSELNVKKEQKEKQIKEFKQKKDKLLSKEAAKKLCAKAAKKQRLAHEKNIHNIVPDNCPKSSCNNDAASNILSIAKVPATKSVDFPKSSSNNNAASNILSIAEVSATKTVETEKSNVSSEIISVKEKIVKDVDKVSKKRSVKRVYCTDTAAVEVKPAVKRKKVSSFNIKEMFEKASVKKD